MRSPGINGEGELRGQPANPGSPGKMAVKMECVCVCVFSSVVLDSRIDCTIDIHFHSVLFLSGVIFVQSVTLLNHTVFDFPLLLIPGRIP